MLHFEFGNKNRLALGLNLPRKLLNLNGLNPNEHRNNTIVRCEKKYHFHYIFLDLWPSKLFFLLPMDEIKSQKDSPNFQI